MLHFLSVLIMDGQPAHSGAMGEVCGTSGYSGPYFGLTSLSIGRHEQQKAEQTGCRQGRDCASVSNRAALPWPA